MRSFIRARFPRFSRKIGPSVNLMLHTAVRARRLVRTTVRKSGYLLRMARKRALRRAFLTDGAPRFVPMRFAQGLRTSFSRRSMWRWHLLHESRVVAVIIGESADPAAFSDFKARLHDLLQAEIVTIARSQIADIGPLVVQRYPFHDVILIDADEPLPDVNALLRLRFAAYMYHGHRRIGIVTPAHQDPDGTPRSIFADRISRSWRLVTPQNARDYGQFAIPRYIVGGQAHGAYLRYDAVARFAHTAVAAASSLNALFNEWVREVVRGGMRVLEYSETHVTSRAPDLADFGTTDHLTGRALPGERDGRTDIIFVLPATTVSGGIRAVLEMAESLLRLGERVEVWSLQANPTWMDLTFTVRKFATYDELIDALSLVDAIKVATWWETAEPVLLGSLTRGIPAQYVQEFESWFYPGNDAAQAAVVAQYRPEFEYITTASYQLGELEEIGITARIIPPAYDSTTFHVNADIPREDGVLLALGRSFFQKNFAQTLAAWKSLGTKRPTLQLFGFEPGIVDDQRARYAVKPSDQEIARLYQSATAFIQTSLHEGFSLPLMEAMACGCPVITTDSHGNRDFCVDGENCLMVEQGDISGTAAAIERLLSDSTLRTRLSAAGIATAQRYTWNRVGSEVRDELHLFARRHAK